ncbi:hypothetical protein DKX38_008481 [Salix brachista]|uniref:RING-type domain-containing protein n=1 Tax=Salix brachista TaxID=2182728 RepID=A0A5N5MRG2_9ROSI|nr:hypothetical protein DKX38_008481 [Salix brachista]
MGQSLDSMTQKQSKDELLHQMAIAGNVDAVKALCSEGASLELQTYYAVEALPSLALQTYYAVEALPSLAWIDREGKTPLIVACMDSGLYNVAKVLIEMGGNVDAYRPGRHAGTPLHHAVKRGQEQTVKLLLSSGANALVRNDDCQTALDVARIKRNINVVRTIEIVNMISTSSLKAWIVLFLFLLANISGSFSDLGLSLAAGLPLYHKVPAIPRSWSLRYILVPSCPYFLNLSISPPLNEQDAQPRTVIALWNANIEEPNFNQPDPELTIFDQSTKTQYRLASANEGDKQQLHWLYDACSGIPQVMPLPMSGNPPTTVPVVAPQTSADAVGLAMSIGGSIHSGWMDEAPEEDHNGWGVTAVSKHSAASSSGWMDEAPEEDYDGCTVPNMGPSGSQGHVQTRYDIPPVSENSGGNTASVPSAPPIPDEALDEGPIHYPSIDFSKLDLSVPAVELGASVTSDVNEGGTSSSCIICWEAPVEGACVPCGHMAGCMPCLSEIKATKGVCPVCRSNINQVIRIYAV